MKVVYSPKALKQINKLDKQLKAKIFDYMDEVASLENPRSRGKALTANLAGLWRYRAGDYRIFCRIMDAELVIYAVEIGHRRDVYKQ